MFHDEPVGTVLEALPFCAGRAILEQPYRRGSAWDLCQWGLILVRPALPRVGRLLLRPFPGTGLTDQRLSRRIRAFGRLSPRLTFTIFLVGGLVLWVGLFRVGYPWGLSLSLGSTGCTELCCVYSLGIHDVNLATLVAVSAQPFELRGRFRGRSADPSLQGAVSTTKVFSWVAVRPLSRFRDLGRPSPWCAWHRRLW